MDPNNSWPEMNTEPSLRRICACPHPIAWITWSLMPTSPAQAAVCFSIKAGRALWVRCSVYHPRFGMHTAPTDCGEATHGLSARPVVGIGRAAHSARERIKKSPPCGGDSCFYLTGALISYQLRSLRLVPVGGCTGVAQHPCRRSRSLGARDGSSGNAGSTRRCCLLSRP